MPPLLCRLFDQLPGQYMLLQPLGPGQLCKPCQIVLPGAAVHVGIVSAGVPGENLLRHIRAADQLFRVQHGKEPKSAEKGLQLFGVGGGVRGVLHGAADLGHALDHRGTEGGGEEQQLLPPQYGDGLKALEKEGAALLGDGALTGVQQRPAELNNQGLLLTEPEMTGGAERHTGAAVLPLYHIPVIQQPFAGGGDGGLAAVAPLDHAVTALNGGVAAL